MSAAAGPGAHAPRFKSNAGVSVAVRVRPRLEQETRGVQGQIVCLPVNSQAVQLGTDSLWGYDVALGDKDGNGSVWDRCQIDSLIEGAFNGFNASIIAYGQTGSGKTYTMGMAPESISKQDASEANSKTARPSNGIAAGVCMAIADALQAVETAVSHGVAGPHGLTSLEVSVSCLQVYCEQLQDVLHPETPSGSIAVRTTRSGATIVTGAQPEPVHSLQDIYRWLSVGIAARTSGGTAMSEASSRSHLVFSIALRGTQLLKDGTSRRMTSIVRLVDLAGSERQKKTQASGTRFAESVHINGGLLALGNVINALASASTAPQGKPVQTHVPYRDSKLTRLLVDCLGGNGRTLFIACVSPTAGNQHETLSTLRYAQRVLAIKNHPAAQVELVPLPEHTPLAEPGAAEPSSAGEGRLQPKRSAAKQAAARRRSASARVRQRSAHRTDAGRALSIAESAAGEAVARTATWLLSLPGRTPAAVLAALQQEARRVQGMLPHASAIPPPTPESASPSAPHLVSAPDTPGLLGGNSPSGAGLDASLLSPVVMPPALPGGDIAVQSTAAPLATAGAPFSSQHAPLDSADGELGCLRRTLALQAAQIETATRNNQEQLERAAARASSLQSEVSLLRSALAAAEASHLSGLAVSRHDISPAKLPSTLTRTAGASAAGLPTPPAPASQSVMLDSPGRPGTRVSEHASPEHASVFDSELEQSIRDAVTPQLQRSRPAALTAERRAVLQGTVRRLRVEVSKAVVSASRARSLDDSNRSWASLTALEAELSRARQELLGGGDSAPAANEPQEHGAATTAELDVSQLDTTPERDAVSADDIARNSVSHGVAAAVAAAAEAVARELETPAAKQGGVSGGQFSAHPPATIGRLRGAVAAAARSLGLQQDSPAVSALQHLCAAAADAAQADTLTVASAAATGKSPEQWLAKERRWNKKQLQLQTQLDTAQAQLAAATHMPFPISSTLVSASAVGGAESPGTAGPRGGELPGSATATPGTGSHQALSHASVPEHTEVTSMSNTATRLDFGGVFESQSDDDSEGVLLVAGDSDEGGSAAALQLLSSLDEAELHSALRGSESPGVNGDELHTSGMVWSLGN